MHACHFITALLLLCEITTARRPRYSKRCTPKQRTVQSFLAKSKSSSGGTYTNTSITDLATGDTTANTDTTGSTGGTDSSDTTSSTASTSSAGSTATTSTTASTSNNETTGNSLYVSFTRYGTGDANGSGNCVTSPNACGGAGGGYTAAISQFLYNSPGAGIPGSACGECWQLTAEGKQPVVVKIDNECPALGNAPCAMTSTTEKNQSGGYANFDLCIDSGSADVVMGDGVGATMGYAVKMASCGDAAGSVQTS